MVCEHVQYMVHYGILTSAVYNPLWHANICSIQLVMAYWHLQYTIRCGILTPAVYNSLWYTNICSIWSVTVLSFCCVGFGVRCGANSAQHPSNNWNFISRECHGITYLHNTNKPWTPARFNMSTVTNRLKITIIKDSNSDGHSEIYNTVLTLTLKSLN